MVLAEMIASGELYARPAINFEGPALSDGIALGHVLLHEPRVVITNVIADDIPKELKRLDAAIATFRAISIACSSTARWPTAASIARCSKPTACSATTRAGCTR